MTGSEVRFRRHLIDAHSEFSASAVIDIDRDGRKDLVCGGFWYRAPDWTRTKLRDVQVIRGRYDDYSNLPLDVNRDGLLDLVSINYRSKSIYWTKNPGLVGELWTRHVIDEPGASETGRLADVNGDGQLDVLPNGTDFAAWYELGATGDADDEVRWIRHELPEPLIGHGLGIGDLNADGRPDLICPRGWAEGPSDARTERWHWHPEFQLTTDASIPIVVCDVDQDGDQDIIWGRGHNLGVYWLEQVSVDGRRNWQRHTIDTEWSEAHAIMLADIDGDGVDELVAGKRLLGHDGRDPAETDPLVVYWYDFDRSSRTWQRHTISWGQQCGFDLDPKCDDVDADGDVDIVAPTRGGFWLLENLRSDPLAGEKATDQVPEAPNYEDHAKLLVVKRQVGTAFEPIESEFDWGLRRAHILGNMQRVMGPLPEPSERVPLEMSIESSEETENYRRLTISFASTTGHRVPAYLLIPPAAAKRPVAAMLCLHPTHPSGKGQVCGLAGEASRHYAHELATRGFVCLAPDYPSFGDYPCDFHAPSRNFVSGSMQAIWDNHRAVDLLESLPYVKQDRIGCIGHSLGGHNALFTAAFDQRIRVIVSSCGFNAFRHYAEGDLTGWTSDRYMPRIAKDYASNPALMPFDFHEVLAATAPRPVFISAPIDDSNFPVQGVKEAVEAARQVYDFQGAADQLHVEYPDASHDFPEDVRHRVYAWLQAKLK